MPASKKNQEEIKDLKKDATSEKSVKKGYNEKNPAQEQGAFNPDSSTGKKGKENK